MDKNTKKCLCFAGLASGIIGGYLLWANRRIFTVNDITTGESLAYPELLSRVYYGDSATVLQAAQTAVKRMPRWRVVHSDPKSETVEAEVETPIGHFLDDVTIYVVNLGGNRCRVTIRSRSRQGRGDFGQNSVHIRDLQDAMDLVLTRNAAI